MSRDQSADGVANGPIILFDALCVLCSANAQFILTHDKAGVFRLAAMQGAMGAALYRQHGLNPDAPNTILVVEGALVRKDSDAVLSIYERLGFPWRMVTILRVVPKAVRDPLYRWVARHRYRLFGTRSSCWIAPTQFLDRILP